MASDATISLIHVSTLTNHSTTTLSPDIPLTLRSPLSLTISTDEPATGAHEPSPMLMGTQAEDDSITMVSLFDNSSLDSSSSLGTFASRLENDRAALRFMDFFWDYRPIPSNYTMLPPSYRWIPPRPLTEEEHKRSSRPTNTICIKRIHIQDSYFPPQYHGTRCALKINPSAVSGRTIKRGCLVILEEVVGPDVNYRVNRVRLFRDDIADVEIVGFTDDGQSHPETSFSWPPVILELPSVNVLMCTEGDPVVTSTVQSKFTLLSSLFFACIRSESSL
ncbi:hypothetical protein GALMADRAFT_148284 [Galerina marginata CBS 339.88]|uniref:Uncharacterized protein n=1 Tax=Galerina marginata (strain CBS 339.88) TaxID=685588 RepID=A0A067SDT1_GALM3|nr:hypothetical protein GALMADRAFT_148284 [Galerina marginata CBS 339.88]